MTEFGKLKIGEVFEHNGRTYQKAEPMNVCVFEPYNANEGRARYAVYNAINLASGNYAKSFGNAEKVEEKQLTMF